MQVIVIGCGKVGARFAQVLSDDGHDIVIVDSDSKSFTKLDQSFNGLTITGVPIDQDVLKQAGIETTDAVIAVTPDDNINIMVCQVAKELFKIPKVMARIYNPERENVFHEFGLQTFCPTKITVEVMQSLLLGDRSASRHTIGDESIKFSHVKVPKKYEHKKLSTYRVGVNQNLFAIIKRGHLLFYKPELLMEQEDIIVIAEKCNA